MRALAAAVVLPLPLPLCRLSKLRQMGVGKEGRGFAESLLLCVSLLLSGYLALIAPRLHFEYQPDLLVRRRPRVRMQISEMGASNPNSEVLKDLADRPLSALPLFYGPGNFLVSDFSYPPSVRLRHSFGILCPARKKVGRRLAFQAAGNMGSRTRALYKPICFMTPATRSPLPLLLP